MALQASCTRGVFRVCTAGHLAGRFALTADDTPPQWRSTLTFEFFPRESRYLLAEIVAHPGDRRAVRADRRAGDIGEPVERRLLEWRRHFAFGVHRTAGHRFGSSGFGVDSRSACDGVVRDAD